MHQEHSLTQRWRALAACLAILLTMTAVLPVSAQTSDSETVTVTANIAAPPSLVITLCDLTATFGSGLNNVGAPPTGTSDAVAATSQGTGVNQGVYYRWTPSCATGTSFIQIESSVAWDLHQCATQAASSSSLAISQADLRFRTALWSDYGNANNSPTFTPCPVGSSQPPVQSSAIGSTTNLMFWYYLRVDDNDTAGSFNATTTWTLTP